MKQRKLIVGAVAVLIGLAALPFNAEAAWRGLRHFNCHLSPASWAYDGLDGRDTTTAIESFQAAHGLTVDGIAGPATYRALGLKYHRTISCGMGGNDVFELQQELATQGFWYGKTGSVAHHGKAHVNAHQLPVPRVAIVPSQVPSTQPNWMEPEHLVTPAPSLPTPEASQLPTPEMTPTPEVAPSPTLAPSPEATPIENMPNFEVGVGTWFMPLYAGSTNYDFSFTRPTWTANAALWWGNWGLGVDATAFNTTYVTFLNTPYFNPNTYMYDADLKYRFDHGFENVFVGYRGIGQFDFNYASVGVGLERPLWSDWLWIQAQAQGGSDFHSSWFLDGNAGLGLHFNPLVIELGFRQLELQNGANPLVSANGPTADLKVRF